MILLSGGTTEGKEVAGWLDSAGMPYIYSTRSRINFKGSGGYRYGPLDAAGFEAFCRHHQINSVINASHPFAEELHRGVASLAPEIRLIRFERAFPERVNHPLVFYVAGYPEALHLLHVKDISSLLVLSGVQSIPKLEQFWKNKRTWFRILDRQESREFARLHGFPAENLLAGYPLDEEEETALLRKLGAQAILTKESGFNGKLPEKIAAAISCRIPIFIIKKPKLPEAYQVVRSKTELFKILNS